MKKIQNLSHLAMITLLLVTSCTLKKRLYMTGFQINYKKERLGAYEHQIANKEKFNAYNKIKIELIDHKNDVIQSKKIIDRKEVNLTATIDNEAIKIQKDEKFISNPTLNSENSFPQINSTFKTGFVKGLQIASKNAGEPKTNGLAIASMILGILSFLTFYGAFLFGLLAIIFGAIALKKIKSFPDNFKGKGMAKAGLICGIVALGLIIIVVATA